MQGERRCPPARLPPAALAGEAQAPRGPAPVPLRWQRWQSGDLCAITFLWREACMGPRANGPTSFLGAQTTDRRASKCAARDAGRLHNHSLGLPGHIPVQSPHEAQAVSRSSAHSASRPRGTLACSCSSSCCAATKQALIKALRPLGFVRFPTMARPAAPLLLALLLAAASQGTGEPIGLRGGSRTAPSPASRGPRLAPRTPALLPRTRAPSPPRLALHPSIAAAPPAVQPATFWRAPPPTPRSPPRRSRATRPRRTMAWTAPPWR